MNPTHEIRSLPAVLSVRSAANGSAPVVAGYAAVFNVRSEDLGGFREVVRPGAFTASLRAGADVRLLINHEGMPLARTRSGTLALSEDSTGLKFTAELEPTDPDVRALVPKLKRGDVSQMSFAFRTVHDSWREEGAVVVRYLEAVDLIDVSPVTYPAYQATEATLRSLERWRRGAGGGAVRRGDDLLRLRLRAAEAEA